MARLRQITRCTGPFVDRLGCFLHEHREAVGAHTSAPRSHFNGAFM